MLIKVAPDYTGQGQAYPIGIYTSRIGAIRAFNGYIKDWLKHVGEITAAIMKKKYKEGNAYSVMRDGNEMLFITKTFANQKVTYGNYMNEEVLQKKEA